MLQSGINARSFRGHFNDRTTSSSNFISKSLPNRTLRLVEFFDSQLPWCFHEYIPLQRLIIDAFPTFVSEVPLPCKMNIIRCDVQQRDVLRSLFLKVQPRSKSICFLKGYFDTAYIQKQVTQYVLQNTTCDWSCKKVRETDCSTIFLSDRVMNLSAQSFFSA